MRRLYCILFGTLLATTACNRASDLPLPPTPSVQASVGVGPRIDIQTRTELGKEESVKWSAGDRLALWAEELRDGSFAIEAVPFALWRYGSAWEEALFRGDIPPMEPSGAYRYYAVSPVPTHRESGSRRAAYEIPSIQDGAFHGEWDIMVADPVGHAEAPAPALTAGDNSKAVTLNFRHKVHLLRIRIPENRLGEKISQITLNFPTEVTGNLSVDITDPSAAPHLTAGSKSLTLRFDEPKDVGNGVYYATIAPVTLSETDQIEIYATGTLHESQRRSFSGKAFAQGHTTPIAYHIPEAGPAIGTIVRLTLGETGENTLGERIRSFTLRVEGASFDNGSAERTFAVDETGTYEMLFPQGSDPTALSGKEVTITYDSEHALLTERFTLPAITSESINEVALPGVPYLLFEDFSSITTNSSPYDNPAVGGTTIASGDGNAVELEQWGLKSAGWTAARVGAEAGKAVRICSRVENQSFKSNTYNARIDSAPLRGLKEGKTVAVRVAFNYKGGRWSKNGRETGNGDAIYSCGYTTEQGWQPGSTPIPHLLKSGVTIPGTSGRDQNQEQNYDGITHADSFDIPAAGATTRASWMVSSTTTTAPFFGFNGNYWLYLDNVKVSIISQATP